MARVSVGLALQRSVHDPSMSFRVPTLSRSGTNWWYAREMPMQVE